MNRVVSLGKLWSQAFAKHGGSKLLNSSGTLFYVAKRRDLRDFRFSKGPGFDACVPRMMFSTTPLINMARSYVDTPAVSKKARKSATAKATDEEAVRLEKISSQDVTSEGVQPSDVIDAPEKEISSHDLTLLDRYHSDVALFGERVSTLVDSENKEFYESQAQLKTLHDRLQKVGQRINATKTSLGNFLPLIPKFSPQKAQEDIKQLKNKLSTLNLDPDVEVSMLSRIDVLEKVQVCHDLQKLLIDLEVQEIEIQKEIHNLEEKVAMMDLRPTSFEDHASIWSFMIRKLTKIGCLRTMRLTTFPRRIANDFLGETFDRKEQIYTVLEYIAFPERFSKADRLAIMVMLAGAGAGKTHMIDQIPRSASSVLDWKEELLNIKKEKLEKDLVLLEDKALTQTKLAKIESELRTARRIREYLSTIFIFVPLSFNSHVRPLLNEEKEEDLAPLIVARILFCYFCVGINYQSFHGLFSDLVKKVSITKAFDVIRYDQSLRDPEDPDVIPKPFATSRCFLMVDEVDKISNISYGKEERKYQLYTTLANHVFIINRKTRKSDVARSSPSKKNADTSSAPLSPEEIEKLTIKIAKEIKLGKQRFPFTCLFTSLDFNTFRRFDLSAFETNTGRPLVWLELTPARSSDVIKAVKRELDAFHIPSSSLLAKYIVMVTSGHWRTIERLIDWAGDNPSEFINDADQCFNALKNSLAFFFQESIRAPTFKNESIKSFDYNLGAYNTGIFDHLLFMMMRHNILKVPFVAESDPKYSVIDALILHDFVVNGSKDKAFKEVPVFSVLAVSQYVKSVLNVSGGKKHNPFLVHLNRILQRACLMSNEDNGCAFEKFQAEYEWFRLMMIKHRTLRSFLHACYLLNRSGTPVVPPEDVETLEFLTSTIDDTEQQKLETPTFESFFNPTAVFGKGKAIVCKAFDPSPSRFLEEPASWLLENSLSAGDVFRPSESNNPGFDFMMKVRLSQKEDSSSRTDYLVLVECKHSDPLGNLKFSHSTLEDKYKALKGTYGKNSFSLGNATFPWHEVIYVVLSAHGAISKPQKGKTYTYPDFKGAILVVTRAQLAERLGSPLNNCGALLQDLHSLPQTKDTTSSSSSSSSSVQTKKSGRQSRKKAQKVEVVVPSTSSPSL